jgi:hypothetical protein
MKDWEMAETILALAVIIAFAYPAFMRWQLVRARPVRARLLHLGQEMLASQDYNLRQKRLIAGMLSDALDWRVMFRAILLAPTLLWDKLDARDLADLQELSRDTSFEEFLRLHFRSARVANPICAAVVQVELAFVLAFFISRVWAPYLFTALAAKTAPPAAVPAATA